MPRGSEYPGPPEALERYAALVDAHGEAQLKGAKNPYTAVNGNMSSFLTPDGLIALRFSEEVKDEVLATHPGADVVTSYGRTMRGYASIPEDVAADGDALTALFRRSWEHVASLPPK